MTTNVRELLAERGQTHGDYSVHARITQELKNYFRAQKKAMRPVQWETLDMIAHKIGRILAGDPEFEDHWRDIAGYATLTADEIMQRAHVTPPAPAHVTNFVAEQPEVDHESLHQWARDFYTINGNWPTRGEFRAYAEQTRTADKRS
jgi:hypothetical protein